MDSLTFSTSFTHHCSLPTRRRSLLHVSPPTSLFLQPCELPTPNLPLKCSSFTSFHSHHQTLNSPHSPESLLLHLSASSPQTPATAMRGAEADAMGLLLKERIVFWGTVLMTLLLMRLLVSCFCWMLWIRLRIFGFLSFAGARSVESAIFLLSFLVDEIAIQQMILLYSATMAIFDVVRLVRADVSTVALGISASTASIILGGGTKGKRFAMPNTRIMIHQPLGGASGQAIDVEIQAREVMHNKNNVTQIISEFSGRSFEQVEKDIDRDRYMSPIEAVEYGIIDGVIDRDSIIPLVPVPERVKASTFNYEEISKDPRKFLTPDIPDDEIY
ncbi:UNVERIFIED_CONTAM: ATP-dependent Clp protease proteolytic subunit, chloroplastic [Sesamum calycinum]|uniref:ATP-dependent Clp protease proteolytic subunit n=1 Tax=Sesamum calycinum TaxID=2727403 RepID=A0AAW2M0E3_9LAMI